MTIDRRQLRDVLRQAMWIAGLVVASRWTKNYAILVLAALGIVWALRRQAGKALVVFMLLSALPLVNPYVMPRYGHFAMMARFTSLAMSFALLASAHTMSPRHRIPLGLLFAFSMVATISSFSGYAPVVSLLKMVNFVTFVMAFYIGEQDIDRDPSGLKILKDSIMALIILVEYGSLVIRFTIPGIAYMSNLEALRGGYGAGFMANAKDLFCGITVHSQALGPLLASCFGWVLCDLLLTNPRSKTLHMLTLAPIPPLLYMTRSRAALLSWIVALVASQYFCLSGRMKAQLRRTMAKMRAYVVAIVVIVALAGIVGEMRSGAVTRWLRKTERVSDDERALSDALMSSRMGLVEECLRDFRRNPMWGMGFQVDATTAEKTKGKGLFVFSAAIEKGVLPVMILGETGIVGSGIFIVFLATFFGVCARRRYKATAALFCVFLASNMGEATFFSPSGAGGLLWVILVAGGFAIDMDVRIRDAALGFEFPPYLPMPGEWEFDGEPLAQGPEDQLNVHGGDDDAIGPPRHMPVPQPC